MAYLIMPLWGEHEPPSDRYVLWSSEVDSPVMDGTRTQLSAFWRDRYGEVGAIGLSRLFDYADEHGSSARSIGWTGELLVMEAGGPGWLPRARLAEFCQAALRDGASNEQLATMLKPVEWNEDE